MTRFAKIKRTCLRCRRMRSATLDYTLGRWTCGTCGFEQKYNVHRGKGVQMKGRE